MDTLIFLLEIIGSVAFAIAGCQVAVQNKMDVFGVCMLGLTTAVGGGVVRDLILGAVPPAMFTDPSCALAALGMSLILFIRPVRKFLFHNVQAVLIADSVGLGVFTAIGTAKSLALYPDNVFLALFVGVLTGVGGGILRDIFANEPPYVFVKHIYALASLSGAIAYVLLVRVLEPHLAVLFSACIVICIRILAATFHWKLPKLD